MNDLKGCRVLVSPTSFGINDSRLRDELESIVGEVLYNPFGRPLTSEELQNLLPGCDGFIAGLDRIDSAAIEAIDVLKVIARYGVGVDNVDLNAAAKKNIIVTNTPTANSASVAELTIGLLLSLARSIPAAAAAVREGKWPRICGTLLAGKTIGLIGFGAIGREVAQRLQNWDVTLLAFDPFADQKKVFAMNVQLTELNALTSKADFLLLHVPLLPETRNLVDADFLSRTKKGAYIINTARGELIDEHALLAALDSGQLAGAALDAFIEEPPPAHSLLRLHPQIIAMPHCGAHTDGAIDNMGRQSFEDCIAVLSGESPRHPVCIQGAAK